MKKIELYFATYDYIENLNPKDPDELSDIVEQIMYAIQDAMYDYAGDNGWEQPEPFI